MDKRRAAAAAGTTATDDSSSHHNSLSAAAAAGCRRKKEDLLGFLLKAQQREQQQQQSSAAGGQIIITDGQIRDEIKTMMFGASDTSGFTLAMLTHHWALHPDAAAAAAAEVRRVLESSGRGVLELRAEDAGKLPFVSACINETLRLTPAGPVITRTAEQVSRNERGKGGWVYGS
jgi:cytochrome P450